MTPIKTCAECGADFTGRGSSQFCSVTCRFWSKFDKSAGPGGCWIWQGYINPRDGYGHDEIMVDGKRKRISVHRRAYQIAKGEPGRLLVRHSCDVRACGNPAHLLVGTHLDNVLDAHARDRPIVARLGEANRYAKLTEAAVRAIRASTEPSTVVGPRFGVVPSRIRSIRRGEGWRHLLA